MTDVRYETMVKQLEKLKPGSQDEVEEKLDIERGNLPIQPIAEKETEKEAKVVGSSKAAANTKNGAIPKSTSLANNKKKEEENDTSPLLVKNRLKRQRMFDESKLKARKWNFITHREEFVELWRDQMTAAKVNENLISNMFHTDFRYHIKALESLMEGLHENSRALTCNLDLILKWLTLRFFDTNLSVIFKGLEYLHSVFKMMAESNYGLETEADWFLPYLVMMFRDADPEVCSGVRSLFKEISHVYPVASVFSYLMKGINKSENARQRAECLEVMGSIIREHGIDPKSSAILKEVAKQISDEDDFVKNAALNCMVEAYYNFVGDKIYKMIGNIIGEDLSLLEGRIKHSKRTTILKPEASLPEFPIEEEVIGSEGDKEEDILQPVIMVQEISEAAGPISLDEDNKIIDNSSVASKKYQEFDLDFLKDDIKIPTVSPAEMEAKVLKMPMSPPKPLDTNVSISRITVGQRQNSPKKQDPLLATCLHQIASQDPNTVLLALQQVIEFLQSHKSPIMLNYVNEFMRSIVTELKHLRNQDPVQDPQVAKIYRSILTAIDAFYHNKNFGLEVSVENSKDIVDQLSHVLVDHRLKNCPNGDAYIGVINLLCVLITKKSDHTKLICAFVKLIHEYMRMGNLDSHTDLVMKWLLRVIQLMPHWGEDVDYSSVLLEVHNFLKEFPSTWWKNKPIDTPIRTIKTIVYVSVQIKGGAIMLHLGKIPNPSESEIESFILKVLKTMQFEVVPPSQTRQPFSRATRVMLDIYMQQHPEADIELFLWKYMLNGLKENEETGKSQSTMENVEKKTSEVITSASETDSRTPEYWENRLELWKKVIHGNVKTGN